MARSLEECLTVEAQTEYELFLPSDHQTPLDEQLDRLVFESAVSDSTQFTPQDITGDRNRGTNLFAHARAYYARCLHPEIESDPALHRFLTRFEGELDRLDFTSDDGDPTAPSREALGRFRTERVDSDWLERCRYLTLRVRDHIGKLFGYESIKDDVTRYVKKDNRVAKEEIRNAYERLVTQLDDHLKDGRDQDKTTPRGRRSKTSSGTPAR